MTSMDTAPQVLNLFRRASELLGFRDRRPNTLKLDELGRECSQEGATVRRVPVELAEGSAVPHVPSMGRDRVLS